VYARVTFTAAETHSAKREFPTVRTPRSVRARHDVHEYRRRVRVYPAYPKYRGATAGARSSRPFSVRFKDIHEPRRSTRILPCRTRNGGNIRLAAQNADEHGSRLFRVPIPGESVIIAAPRTFKRRRTFRFQRRTGKQRF